MIASILPKLWNDMRRKTTTVMGERFSFAARIAPGRSGAMRVHGPILLEDRNATDLWIRDFYRRLEELPDPHPEVVVECDGTKLELSSDGRFRAPPGRPVVIRWGPFGTTLAPGQELPFTDDGRLHAPGREDR